jgi:hypothetical protein
MGQIFRVVGETCGHIRGIASRPEEPILTAPSPLRKQFGYRDQNHSDYDGAMVRFGAYVDLADAHSKQTGENL